MAAAIGESENRIIGDLVSEADATAAHDAALVVEPDTGTDGNVLRLFHLPLTEAGFAFAVLDAELLQAAFPRLITNRAVEGVIREEKFHHALAAFFGERAGRAYAHVRADRVRAGDHGTGHPGDGKVAVFVGGGCFGTRSGARWHPHFDEAHAAVAGRSQLGVITIVRDFDPGLTAGFDHPHSFGKLIPHTVDFDVN